MTIVNRAPLGPVARGGNGLLDSRRAQTLLAAGVLGAHAVALVVIGVCWLALGRGGLVAALFGAALVIVFQTIGAAVQVRFARADPRTLMAASLASFGARAALLLFVLWAWFNLASPGAELSRVSLVASASLTLVGWLGAEAYALHRLRIPNFDEPETGAAEHADGPGAQK